MRDYITDFQNYILRLVEYAKTPSIWYNGIEYKWDKKQNKFLHWSTVNGRRVADEPPYEATNPLFAAAGVNPDAEDKPLPPMTTNRPIGREKEEKEPKEADNYDHSKYTSLENELDQRIMEFAADKTTPDSLAKEGALHFFPTTPEDVEVLLNELDDEIEFVKKHYLSTSHDDYLERLKSIQTPEDFAQEFQHFKETQTALLEYLDTWKQREPRLTKPIEKYEDYTRGELSRGPDVVAKYEEAYNAKVRPLIEEEEALKKKLNSEEKPLPPMTENSHIGDDTQESSGPTYQQIRSDLASSDLNVSEKNQRVKEWTENFFPDGEQFATLKNFFTSDQTPFYAKKDMAVKIERATELGRIVREARRLGEYDSIPEFETIDELLDFCSQTSILNPYETIGALDEEIADNQKKMESDWSTIQHEDFFSSGRSYWDGLKPFTRNLRWGKDEEKFRDRASAIKNFRSLFKIPSVLSKEEKQSVLDRIAYVCALAKLPTTTDDEACMLMTELYSNADKTIRNAQYAALFDERFQDQDFQERMAEIAARSDSAPEMPKELIVAPKDETEQETDKGSTEYASSAKAFASIIEAVRNEEMTPEEAERDRKETKALVDACQYIEKETFEREYKELWELKRAYSDAYSKKALALESFKAYMKEKHPRAVILGISYYKDMLQELDGPESARVSESEKAEIHTLAEGLKDKDARFNAAESKLNAVNKEKYNYLEKRENNPYDHEKTLKFLKKAFPDRGGDEFITPEYREEIKKVFEKQNPEFVKVADEVLDVYDIIGRCFNRGGREFKSPTISFGSTSSGNLGECNGTYITLSSKRLRHPEKVRTTFAHELGHWLEEECCGVRRINDNAGWLKAKLGHLQLEKNDQWDFQKGKTPGLTVRPDGYSYRIYRLPAWIFGSKDKDFHRCRATELISTGMEYLAAFPTIFTRRAPEHFNLLVRNFEELAQHDKDE